MVSLARIAEERTDLGAADVGVLEALVGRWSLVADLARADLVLWLPTWNRAGQVAAALVRPATAPTTVPTDVVGSFIPRGRRVDVDRVLYGVGREVSGTVPVPGPTGGVIAALEVRRGSTAQQAAPPGSLEGVYAHLARLLLGMVATGTFPSTADVATGPMAPRVGDGLIVLDSSGRVTFASPNAVSAFHRLGLAAPLEGSDLARTAVRLWHRPGPVAAELAAVAGGRIAGESEIEGALASVAVRGVPLWDGAEPAGALVLVRDVTDLRRSERELMSKDAALREVHHRVKNNLQTVAALMRLQARRVDQPEARSALVEAGRRVAAIATVHEILATEPGDSVDFDGVLERLVQLARDLAPAHAADGSVPIIECRGSIGLTPTDVASPLAMAVSELLHNAVEHADAGRIRVTCGREGRTLRVTVRDDGRGVGAAVPGLGLQIVRMLIEEDLGGGLSVTDSPDGGTRAEVTVDAVVRTDPHRRT